MARQESLEIDSADSKTADSDFDALAARLKTDGPDGALDLLAERLRAEHKYHELFDALLMRSRQRLGVPIIHTTAIDDLAEPLRSQVEAAYLDACREVGKLLLADGALREAWMYLRPVGDKAMLAEAIRKIEPDDENLQDLIEIALHEGIAPAWGYQLVLDHYGTCNAITTFEGAVLGRPRADQQAAAERLVGHLHRDLLSSVCAEIAKQAGQQPVETTLATLVADRDWLFLENNYHVDTTHLNSTVRFARLLEDRAAVELAWDLTEYGRRLGRQFQFAGEEPFVDAYAASGLFFAAQLGRQVDEAVAYFGERARAIDAEQQGTAAAETFVVLLVRLGRLDEAIAAAAELIPPGTRTTGLAPSLLELSRQAGRYERLMQACRERGDLIGFAAGLLSASGK